MQAEASGGTLVNQLGTNIAGEITSLPSPAKFRWLRLTLNPSQKQPQDIDSSVHVPAPQYTFTSCVSAQSYTVALGAMISATSLCRQTLTSQRAAAQYCTCKHQDTLQCLSLRHKAAIACAQQVTGSSIVLYSRCMGSEARLGMCQPLQGHRCADCQLVRSAHISKASCLLAEKLQAHGVQGHLSQAEACHP